VSLTEVALTLDLADAAGNYLTQGSANLAPSAVLTDSADHLIAGTLPVTVPFRAGAVPPSVRLLATDNAALLPSGWTWSITPPSASGIPAFSFFLPAGPLSFTATDATPCVFTAAGSAFANGTSVTLAGGSLPAGFTAATTYYVVNASGTTFELAATLGGSPLASTSAGSGPVTTAGVYLSSLSPVSSGTAFTAYMPLPAGTPASGMVPVATGSGEASAWTSVGGTGTVTSVSVASANGFAGSVANPSSTPAISVQTSVTGLLKGNGTAVSAASAGTDYLAPNGNGAALTGITAAQVGADASGAAAAAQAASLPLAGGTMSGAIAMGAHKITGLTNGSGAQDAAAFGQLPSSSSPLPLLQGGTGTSAASANAAYNALSPMTTTGDIEYESAAGVASRLAGPVSATKQFLTSTGTGSAAQAPAWGTIAAGDVPVLNQNTTGTAAALSASSALPNGTTATTQSPGDATAKVATTAYADAAVTVAEGLALPKAGGTMTGWLAPAVATLTFVGSGTTLVNAALGNAFSLTLTASTTLGNPTNPVDGQVIRVRVIQDGTGSRTLAYGTAYDFGAAGAPTLSTGASKVDILGFEYVASLAKWAYLGSGLGF